MVKQKDYAFLDFNQRAKLEDVNNAFNAEDKARKIIERLDRVARALPTGCRAKKLVHFFDLTTCYTQSAILALLSLVDDDLRDTLRKLVAMDDELQKGLSAFADTLTEFGRIKTDKDDEDEDEEDDEDEDEEDED